MYPWKDAAYWKDAYEHLLKRYNTQEYSLIFELQRVKDERERTNTRLRKLLRGYESFQLDSMPITHCLSDDIDRLDAFLQSVTHDLTKLRNTHETLLREHSAVLRERNESRDKLADARYENTRLREQLDQPSATQPEDDTCRMWMEHPIFDNTWCFAEDGTDCLLMSDDYFDGDASTIAVTTGPPSPWRDLTPDTHVSFFQYMAELNGRCVFEVKQSISNGIYRVHVSYVDDNYDVFYWRAKPCT